MPFCNEVGRGGRWGIYAFERVAFAAKLRSYIFRSGLFVNLRGNYERVLGWRVKGIEVESEGGRGWEIKGELGRQNWYKRRWCGRH